MKTVMRYKILLFLPIFMTLAAMEEGINNSPKEPGIEQEIGMSFEEYFGLQTKNDGALTAYEEFFGVEPSSQDIGQEYTDLDPSHLDSAILDAILNEDNTQNPAITNETPTKKKRKVNDASSSKQEIAPEQEMVNNESLCFNIPLALKKEHYGRDRDRTFACPAHNQQCEVRYIPRTTPLPNTIKQHLIDAGFFSSRQSCSPFVAEDQKLILEKFLAALQSTASTTCPFSSCSEEITIYSKSHLYSHTTIRDITPLNFEISGAWNVQELDEFHSYKKSKQKLWRAILDGEIIKTDKRKLKTTLFTYANPQINEQAENNRSSLCPRCKKPMPKSTDGYISHLASHATYHDTITNRRFS